MFSILATVVFACLLGSVTAAPRRAQHDCHHTSGGWCVAFHEQERIPWRPPPVFSKTCPNNCSQRGNCHADSGLCYCPAGWTGPDCSTPQKRPCSNRVGDPLTWQPDKPSSFIGPDKRDLDLREQGHTPLRCAGWCDDDLGWCWCHEGKYKHVPAPEGSPPGTAPMAQGRPYLYCSPRDDGEGNTLPWQHDVVSGSWNSTFHGDGWCNADVPVANCPCPEGYHGSTCDIVSEHFCINQCSGRGLCYLGFCKCHQGWYGQDCSRRAGRGVSPEEADAHTKELPPWLQYTAAMPPAALDLPPRPTRLRPLIYVYDLEPLFSAKLLQYRMTARHCTHRYFVEQNASVLNGDWGYAVETLLHESLLQSRHRTFDPEEADFFYVPAYLTCMAYPIFGWADFPWFGGVGGPRVKQMAALALDANDWVQHHFPYFNRTNGTDHIWYWGHDEGACYAPSALYQGIMLTHWGKMDRQHVSETAHPPDNYTEEYRSAQLPDGWLHLIQGHPCYDPDKDLVLPSFKQPWHHHASPYFGGQALERDILLFLRGDVGKGRLPWYSRGVRQKLYNLTVQHGWTQKYNIQVGDMVDVQGDYSKLLARSKFCVVVGGDGWSGRAEDAVLHGCVPLVIMDNVHPSWGGILDWPSFSVRLREAELGPDLPQRLLGMDPAVYRSLQANLSQVWLRFQWFSTKSVRRGLHAMLHTSGGRASHLLPGGTAWRHARRNDAFSTLLQWLHSKMRVRSAQWQQQPQQQPQQ